MDSIASSAPAAVLALALLPSAVLADEKPDWLSGRSSAYPNSSFITGVGEGPSQEKAADKARAEVAKFLGIELTAQTAVSARETSSSGFSQEVSDEVRTSTAKLLEGVEVAQYWRSPEGRQYALAVLRRAHSASILKDKLEEYDANLKEWSAALPETEGRFTRLKLSLKILQASRDRRRLNADYRIVNPEGKGLPPPASYEAALAQARKAVSALTVQVAASGAQAERIRSRLLDGLTARGLRAVERGARAADVVVEADGEAEALPPENLLFYWAKGAVRVRITYGPTGEIFSRFEESGQDTARDPGSAMDSVLAGLSDKAASRAFKAIISAELDE